MEIINLEEFVEDLNKHNTFIIDGQLCLGGAVTRNYKENGIPVLADLNHLKWIIRDRETEHIIRIEKNGQGSQCLYKIVFDDIPSRNVIAYTRNDIETIPAEDCGTDFLKLLDKDIFDDSKSFIVKDNGHSVAVIGLDLRKLRLTVRQKLEIAKEMRKSIQCIDPPTEKNPSETLCLVVEIDDYSFSFQGLDVNTLNLKLLSISTDLHTNNKVNNYTEKMINCYNLAHKNIKKHAQLMKELCELTESTS